MLIKFFPGLMATSGNERKLAAVSRRTAESTRNSKGQNTLDPELTQDCISQVSEEIEGRVTKKLSKEVSRTESGILGALSKLDEFPLNPQVRTCSVAVPGTSRNNVSGNRETAGDRTSPFCTLAIRLLVVNLPEIWRRSKIETTDVLLQNSLMSLRDMGMISPQKDAANKSSLICDGY